MYAGVSTRSSGFHDKIEGGFLTVGNIRHFHHRKRLEDRVGLITLFAGEKELGGEDGRTFRGAYLDVNVRGAGKIGVGGPSPAYSARFYP